MSEIGEELRLLYTTCITEIAFFKQQQWRVTNYALLIYVVIVGIPKFLGSLNRFEYILLFVFAAVVFGAGYWVLGLLSDSIKIRLEQQTNVRNRFTTNFKLTWRYHEPKDNTLITIDTKPKNEKPNLRKLFRSILLVGFAVTCWLLYRTAPPTDFGGFSIHFLKI